MLRYLWYKMTMISAMLMAPPMCAPPAQTVTSMISLRMLCRVPLPECVVDLLAFRQLVSYLWFLRSGYPEYFFNRFEMPRRRSPGFPRYRRRMGR